VQIFRCDYCSFETKDSPRNLEYQREARASGTPLKGILFTIPAISEATDKKVVMEPTDVCFDCLPKTLPRSKRQPARG
jgi:hypothetical protein